MEKVSNLPIWRLKAGVRLFDPDTKMTGTITKVEHDVGDTYTWVEWENSDRRSGFWGNHVDFEIIEENNG